ncbi:type IV pilus twitching motility protein PilT [bacterium]|jgi:twitching motility protein PilT|nr:type IV pilus twitching motility protein PilT [bacterium]
MAYDIHQLLEAMIENGASDLHLHVGRAPSLRVSGSVISIEGAALTPEDTEGLVQSITPPEQLERLKRDGGCDYGFSFHKKARFRVNVYRGKGVLGMVLRLIPAKMYTLEQLRLPPMIKDLLRRPRGLILVTGPTGSGKSTTLASMIDWINQNEDGHIVTIEDPIEYYHAHKNCVVTQREVHNDVPSFADGIRSALRQDPDVILIGEMRDLETIEAAVSAAETGHLVFGTLHTTGAARTVDRILDAFPAGARDQIRVQLASSVVAVISQCLLRTTDDKRVAAYEIMIRTDGIAAKIRENKTFQITSDIETGAARGMRTLDADLLALFNQGLIAEEEVFNYAQDAEMMRQRIKGGAR